MSANFAIVNLRDGTRKDIESFLINNDSFPILENAYLFRGRIQRRSCFSPVGVDGRLKGTIGTTGASPFLANLLDGTGGLIIPEGQSQFKIGSVILTDPGGASPVALISTDPMYSGTLDRTTGALSIAHPVIAATPVIYIPGIPVMGLRVREQIGLANIEIINDEQLIAFDTRYTYLFDVGTDDFIFQNTFAGTANTFVWTGTDSDFFWTVNYFRAFWATNNIQGFHALQDTSPVAERDGIRWYGTVGGSTGWRNFNPRLDSGSTSFLQGGLIILPYKGRLVILSPWEGLNLAGATKFPQRARWCQNGTPYYSAFPDGTSADAASWDSGANDIGRGGFIDAPTGEVIVSAEFIKDTLIVYFERSTWQLVYTYNEYLPFVWQKINTELGCESTFSIVPFDRGVFGIGNYGIITCDSVNVVRIDQKIPDTVFQIQNKNNGTKRTYGIRDYSAQLVYWTFPILDEDDSDAPNYTLTYPNQVLVYNYIDGSWAEFDDSFTCFGYWQKFSDRTWQYPVTWAQAQFSWNAGVNQARYPDVIAGNQRGFVMVYSQLQNLGQNSPSLPISNITNPNIIKVYNHNLTNNQYVLINSVQGTSGINGNIYKVTVIDVNTIILDTAVASGTYTGGGLITHIPNMLIQTKEFNPFYENGDGLRLNYIDIYLDQTDEGQFTAQFFTSDNTSSAIEEDSILTSSEPPPTYSQPSPTTNYALSQNKIWHRVYSNAFGSFVQNIFTLSDSQIRDADIAASGFRMHGLIYYVSQAGRLPYDI